MSHSGRTRTHVAMRTSGIETRELPSTWTPSGLTSAADLRGQLLMLWRRKWLVLACIVLIPTAIYGYYARQPKLYRSVVVLQVQAQAMDSYVSLFVPPYQSPGETLDTAAQLTATTTVARVAAVRLKPRPPSPQALVAKIKAVPDAPSFLRIYAVDTDPRRAADIANAFGVALRQTRTAAARARITPAMDAIQRSLHQLGGSVTDAPTRTELRQQLQQLMALRAAQANNAQIVQPAAASLTPVAPRPLRSALLGLLLGALIGVSLALLMESLDRRVRDSDELETLAEAPLLGIVPLAGPNGSKRKTMMAEAFQTLRASLFQFNLDRAVHSIVVCSPLKGDGKTTVATNLATALARAGKCVVLVDADMRHPQVHSRLAVRASPGLGDVLSGESALGEALVEGRVKEGRLLILPSGQPPSNPSELIASEGMRTALTEMQAIGDVVIIDTPPTLQVSDAVPLFERVSGVVVIGRLDKTTRPAMRRLMSVVEAAGGTTLGVVATAEQSSKMYGYGGYGARYGRYYAGTPSGSKGAPGSNGAPRKRKSVRNPRRRKRRPRRRWR